MGLDSVELVIKIEDTFNIAISDEDASQIRTVGDMYSVILKKLKPAHSSECLTSYSFYHLRSALIGLFGHNRRSIAPSTSMEVLVPWQQRRKSWKNIENKLDLALPGLERPVWLARALVVGFIVLFSISILAGLTEMIHKGSMWAMMIASFFVFLIAIKLTEPWAVYIPSTCATAGHVAKKLLSKNFRNIVKERKSWNELEVWELLKVIVADQLGLDENEVTKDANFVDDLGVC